MSIVINYVKTQITCSVFLFQRRNHKSQNMFFGQWLPFFSVLHCRCSQLYYLYGKGDTQQNHLRTQVTDQKHLYL